MTRNLAGTVWRVAILLVVCGLGIFVILAIFAQLRFQPEKTYNAMFTDVSGLKDGNFVRIADVEVSADDSVVLTEGTKAVVRYQNLVGDRFLALEQGAGDIQTLKPGQTIPIERTAPALDLDALIGGFRPLLRALDPDQVNALTGQLVQAFQGQGATIGSFLAQTASVTNTLADRDLLIGQVVNNLNTVLGSLGEEGQQFDKALDSLAELVHGLADRKVDISDGVANIDAAAGSITDLLARARPPLQNTVHQVDRAAGVVIADHDYLDNLLNTLPDKYQILAREGLYGDFFNFYLCDAVLKLNGKGGQPVYVKVVGQASGRCTPK